MKEESEIFHKEDLSNSTFLITGGAGFIGSHLSEYLLKHHAKKVCVADDLSTGLTSNIELLSKHKNFEFAEGDISDYTFCQKITSGIDYVSHQAALGSIPRSVENPLATHNANVNGFLNIIEASRKTGVKKIVFASSSSVYGDSPDLPKKEEKIGTQLSPYAVTKRTNELYAEVYAALYKLPILGLRYFNIFGPRQNPKGPYAAAIPLFFDALISRNKIYINGDGEQSRDFTYVDNAVKANILALFSNNTSALGKIFNIAAGHSVTINSLVQKMIQVTGVKTEPVYRAERAGDIRHSLADISLAKNLLNYSPSVSVDKGLQLTFESIKRK